jgi:hypothetical protein
VFCLTSSFGDYWIAARRERVEANHTPSQELQDHNLSQG